MCSCYHPYLCFISHCSPLIISEVLLRRRENKVERLSGHKETDKLFLADEKPPCYSAISGNGQVNGKPPVYVNASNGSINSN